MKTYIVVKSWEETYPNPITIFGGQEVMVDKSRQEDDPEWQGWVWCISADNSGWVPIQILTLVEQTNEHLWRASVNEDYTAKELTTVEGEIVSGDKILNGWLWCHKEEDKKFGWLPLRNLKEQDY